MKKLTQKQYADIAAWIHRNAREIDLRIFECAFENGIFPFRAITTVLMRLGGNTALKTTHLKISDLRH